MGERIANPPDLIPMAHISPGIGSEGIRPQEGEEQRHKQSSKAEVIERTSKEEDKEEEAARGKSDGYKVTRPMLAKDSSQKEE